MSYRDIQLDATPPLGFRVRTRLRRSVAGRMLYRWRWTRNADVYSISFPKAGRTWLRLLLARALARHLGVATLDWTRPEALAELHPNAPRIRFKHDDNPQLKTPEELVTSKSEYRDLRVILLVRDIRDLAVSSYFQMTRREKRYSGDIASFLRCPRGGVDTMIRFYNIWAENRHVPAGLLLVRYEDLHADTARELRRVLGFVGVGPPGDDVIREAVEFARFDNMRRLEQSDALGSGRLRPADRADAESYKTRRGKVRGYADYLAPEDVEWLERRIAAELSPFYGYGEA